MFDWMDDEKPLAPALAQGVEGANQALPDEVQLRAWMGRERRGRADLKGAEAELFAGYADEGVDEAELRGLAAREETHDRCMSAEERRAAAACLKGRGPGHVSSAGMTPEECMMAWRDGRAVTGGADSTSSSRSTTDGSSSSEALEMSATAEIGPVPKAGISGKGNVTRGRSHADTQGDGTSETRSWTTGHGYMATCDAEADRAEASVRAVTQANARNIAAAGVLRDRFATPWKGR